MSPQRLGCLSPLALLSAMITLSMLLVVKIISGDQMFSPGDLNAESGKLLEGMASHAEIGEDCGQCHTPFWTSERMADRCLACHNYVQAELGDPSTLHGALIRNTRVSCHSCHTEHNGPTAPLTMVSGAQFPHEVTGFSLTGHQAHPEGIPFICGDCHNQGFSTFDLSVCSECHLATDEAYMITHVQNFGNACLACHDGVDQYGDFDHSKVSFALTGAHAQAACSGCHLNARARADLENTPMACVACHLEDDAHEGLFGTACEVCHRSEAWKPATFDHTLSAVPLVGAHREVAGTECHNNEAFKGTPIECAACHAEPVYHAGLFPDQACSVCHTTAAWSPARYADPHTFPMDHGEEENTCADCHQPNLTTWTCYTCHERAEVEEEHIEEGIFNYSDCLECHPTGQEDEAEDREDD